MGRLDGVVSLQRIEKLLTLLDESGLDEKLIGDTNDEELGPVALEYAHRATSRATAITRRTRATRIRRTACRSRRHSDCSGSASRQWPCVGAVVTDPLF